MQLCVMACGYCNLDIYVIQVDDDDDDDDVSCGVCMEQIFDDALQFVIASTITI